MYFATISNMASDGDTPDTPNREGGDVISLAERRTRAAEEQAEKDEAERLAKMSLRELVEDKISAQFAGLREHMDSRFDDIAGEVLKTSAKAKPKTPEIDKDELIRTVAFYKAKEKKRKEDQLRRAMREAKRIRDVVRTERPPTTPPSGPPRYPGQWLGVEQEDKSPGVLWWLGVAGAMALGTYGVCKGIGYVMARNAEREQERKQLRAYERAMLEAESNPTVHNTYVQHGLGKAEVQEIVIDSLRENGLSRAEARAIAEQGLADVVDSKVAASADDLRLHLDNRFSRAEGRTAKNILDTVNGVASQLKPQHHHHQNTYDDSPIRGELDGIRSELDALKRERSAPPQFASPRYIDNTKTVVKENPYNDSAIWSEIRGLTRKYDRLSNKKDGIDYHARSEIAKLKKQKPVNVTENHYHEDHYHEHKHVAKIVKAPKKTKSKAKAPKPLSFDTDAG